MIKTRKVKVIGKLYLQSDLSYLLIRQEELGPGFTGQVAGFTVTDDVKHYNSVDDFTVTSDDVYHVAPFFVVGTQYAIEYSKKPFEINVEDDLDDEEADDTDIPEPVMTEDEWEHNLNRIDMENPNENSQA